MVYSENGKNQNSILFNPLLSVDMLKSISLIPIRQLAYYASYYDKEWILQILKVSLKTWKNQEGSEINKMININWDDQMMLLNWHILCLFAWFEDFDCLFNALPKFFTFLNF